MPGQYAYLQYNTSNNVLLFFFDRNMLLDLVLSKLEGGECNSVGVHEDNMAYICELFTEEAHILLKISQPQEEATEIVR